MDSVRTPKIAVITPTTGSFFLKQCVTSIARQSYGSIRHYVVIDGKDREAETMSVLADTSFVGEVIALPEATGKNKFYGHRIYGSLPFLVDADFVAFLDEDNWLDPQHFQLLVEQITSANLEWAYGLRSIVSNEGEFICRDECQSLGWWPAFDGAYHFIDTNCYLISRSLAIEAAGLWNRQGYISTLRDPDRELCRWLLNRAERGFTSGAYTVNYRLPSGEAGAFKRGFFQLGNSISAQVYGRYPWRITAPNPRAVECRHLELMPRDPAEAASVADVRSGLRLLQN
jgi:glycosyltransferase involved in cell wall biosynthesis